MWFHHSLDCKVTRCLVQISLPNHSSKSQLGSSFDDEEGVLEFGICVNVLVPVTSTKTFNIKKAA